VEKGEGNKSQVAAVQALIRSNEERLARIRAAMASVDAHLHLTEDNSHGSARADRNGGSAKSR
jgi:hypothetical protein